MRIPVFGLLAIALLMAGCAENSYYNGYSGRYNKTLTGAGIGALGGAAIGAATAQNPTQGALIGAGAGAVVGGGVGYYLDQKDKQPPPPYGYGPYYRP